MATSCIWFSWITAQDEGTEHAVTDEAHVAGMDAGKGIYLAVCGANFLAACMDAGPRRRCPFCRARTELRDRPERMSRPSWLSRLFCHKHPAGVGSERPPAPTSAGPQGEDQDEPRGLGLVTVPNTCGPTARTCPTPTTGRSAAGS